MRASNKYLFDHVPLCISCKHVSTSDYGYVCLLNPSKIYGYVYTHVVRNPSVRNIYVAETISISHDCGRLGVYYESKE